jgi:hypothetical protein
MGASTQTLLAADTLELFTHDSAYYYCIPRQTLSVPKYQERVLARDARIMVFQI